MFVSSAAERGVAVADLSNFRRMQTIALNASPCALIRTGSGVGAVCADPAVAVRIDPAQMSVVSRLRLPARPLSAVPSPDGSQIAILASEPDCVIILDANLTRILGKIPLPGRGEAIDVWQDEAHTESRAAVSVPTAQSIVRISLSERRSIGHTETGAFGSPLRFRFDGKELLAGDTGRRQVICMDWQTGRLLARLPVGIQPKHFCYAANGGQLFVTGPGGDFVAIVAPYQYEVYETIPAGRSPGPMAVSAPQNLLLVANPENGDLTLLDIETRQLAASVHVGDTTGEVLVTPDGEYALIVSKDSGAVAVIRLTTVLNRGENALTARGIKPLFTVFPMTTAPGPALIVPATS
jgi:DNA-binding beta-propeller fold protein YncE